MATYRTIASSEIDHESPITEQLASAWTDNPTAIMEGAAGAPRLARHVEVDSGNSGNLDFTSLSEFQGAEFKVYAENSGGGTVNLSIALSDDNGSTFDTASNFATIGATSETVCEGFIDFATGALSTIESLGSAGPSSATATVAGASASVDAIRFAVPSNTTMAVMIYAVGGASTV